MDGPTRMLWLALMVMFSVMIGGVVTWLTWASSKDVYTALVAGGAGVGGTLVVLIAVYYFATHKAGTSS